MKYPSPEGVFIYTCRTQLTNLYSRSPEKTLQNARPELNNQSKQGAPFICMVCLTIVQSRLFSTRCHFAILKDPKTALVLQVHSPFHWEAPRIFIQWFAKIVVTARAVGWNDVSHQPSIWVTKFFFVLVTMSLHSRSTYSIYRYLHFQTIQNQPNHFMCTLHIPWMLLP